MKKTCAALMVESNPDLPCLLKPEQAAEFLNVSPRTLWRLTASGDVPVVRLGRTVRYRRQSLSKWIESQETHAKGSAQHG